MLKLTDNHFKLYDTILDRGIGRICNDLSDEEVQLLTPLQWEELNLEFHIFNGDVAEFYEQEDKITMYDYQVRDIIQHILRQNYKMMDKI